MNFKKIAITDGVSSIVNAITTLSCALSGLEYWSLVYGGLAAAVTKALLLNYKSNTRYHLTYKFELLNEAAKFSSLTVLNRLMWLLYTKFDVIIIGKLLGTVSLGFYSVAMQIAALPLMKVGAIINQVSFTAYAKVSKDIKKVRYYFLLSNKILSVISFPLFFGIAALAEGFVFLVLGNTWSKAIVPLQILSLIVPFRVLALAIQAMFQGIGKPSFNTKNLLFAVIALPICIVIGTKYSLEGVAVGWAIGFSIYYFRAAYKAVKYLTISPTEYFWDITIPMLAATAMLILLVTIEFKDFFDDELSILAAKAVLGALIYIGLLLVFGKERLVHPLISLLKK